MATKLDTDKRLFMGPTQVREGTVVDAIRQAVRDLDKGEGVSYQDLEKHMLENWAPKKSQGYGASYIKAYVRDAVNRYDHLGYEDKGHEYGALAAPEPKPKPPKKLTKAQQAEIDSLNFIRTRGEISDAGDLDGTQITVQDFVTETGKKTKTVEKQLATLEKDGFVRTESKAGNEGEEPSVYVFLTQAGLARLNEAEAQAEGSEATAETSSAESEPVEA
jgi:DNA-binding MarR family transcriptional regulator